MPNSIQSVQATGNRLSVYHESIAAPIRWCYLLFIWSVFFEQVQFSEMMQYTTFAKILGILLAGVAILQAKLCYARPPKIMWLFMAYVVVYSIRGMAQDDIGDVTVSMIFSYVQSLFLFWLSYNIFRYSDIWKSVFTVIVLANTSIALLSFLGQSVSVEGRETMFMLNMNGLAFQYNLGIFSAIALAMDKSNRLWWRLIIVPMLLLMVGKLAATGSRSGMLCLALSLVAYGLSIRGLSGKIKGVIVISVVSPVLLYFIFQSDVLQQRWSSTLESGDTSKRETIFMECVDMVRSKPFLGWGPTTHLEELARREQNPSRLRDTHNDIMFVLTATGLLGGVFFILGMGLCLKEAWRGRRWKYGPICFGLTVAVLVMGLSGTMQYVKMFWVIMAMAIVSGNMVSAGLRKQRAAPQLMQRYSAR